LNREIFSLAKDDAVIMHPGPINRGVELSDELADCERSLVLRQVESGVAVRMALLYLLAGGSMLLIKGEGDRSGVRRTRSATWYWRAERSVSFSPETPLGVPGER